MNARSPHRCLKLSRIFLAGLAAIFLSACFVEPPRVTATAKTNRSLASMPHTGSMLTSCLPCHVSNVPTGIVGGLNHAAAVVANQPTNCVSCHVQGAGTTWKGATFNHLGLPNSSGATATLKTCYICHSPDVPAVPVNRFDHKVVDVATDGACSTCHTQAGVTFAGADYHRFTKSATQPNNPFPAPTTCASCHTVDRPIGPVGMPAFDHANGGTGDCISCHNKPGLSWTGGTFAHTPKPATCISCHVGQRPVGPVGPPPMFDHALGGMGDCVFCHAAVPTAINPNVTFAGGQFSHSPTPTSCSSCHASERPVGLVPVNPPLGTAQFDHAKGGMGDCVSCHTSVAANIGVRWSGAEYKHDPQPATCVECHATKVPGPTVLVPTTRTKDLFVHAANFGGTKDCATCHLKTPANLGVTWSGGFFNHTDATGKPVATCIQCHTGNRPTIPVNGFDHSTSGTGDCISCHTQPGVSWASSTVVHVANGKVVPTSCTSCHLDDRPATNVLVPVGGTKDLFLHSATYRGTSDCITCHTSVIANVGVNWKGGTFDHKTSAGTAPTTCLPCHTGNRPTTTINGFSHATSGTGDCVGCHKQPGVTWTGGTFSHVPRPTTCIGCHLSDKPAGTVPNTRDGFNHLYGSDCVTCHISVTANIGVRWSGGKYNHTPQPAKKTCLPCHSTRDHNQGKECATCHTTYGSWNAN